MPQPLATWRTTPARSLAGAIMAVRREAQVRMDYYPKRVRAGKISPEYARWEIEAMIHAQDLLDRMANGDALALGEGSAD